MGDTKQDIQDATSDKLFNNPTPNTNLLDNADSTINGIREFLKTQNYRPEPPTTPISQFSPPTTHNNLTPDIQSKARATITATSTASAPNTGSPANTL